MKEYLWSREDYIESLVEKFYSKNDKMKKAVYIYGQDCQKCRFLEPHVEKRAKENGIELEKVGSTDTEIEITSVPTLVWNGVQYDYESIVNLITKK